MLKLNNYISKILSVGLFMSPLLTTTSFATSNFTETIEGKLLSINDTYLEEISELEIFGETYQDENDLSNIQSVGDLYIDESGNPILDSRGNEQYIIRLVSRNKNLFNNNDIVQGFYNLPTDGGEPVFRESNIRLTLPTDRSIPVKPNTTITCKSEKFNFGLFQLNGGVYIPGSGTGWKQNSYSFTTKAETTHISLNISKGDTPAGTEEITPDDLLPGDIMIYYGDKEVDLIDCISNEVEIILPYQLDRLGDVADKMYYDKSTNSFLIEKNVENIILDETQDWYVVNGSNPDSFLNNTLYFGTNGGFDNLVPASKVISDRFKQPANTILSADEEGITVRKNSQSTPTLYIKIETNKLEALTIPAFKNWLKDNNVLVKCASSTPKYNRIYLKDKKINIQDGETNIFIKTSSSMQPSIKVVIDRLINKAVEAVEKAIEYPSVESISNARLLINKIKSSTIKDILQERINAINDISDTSMDKKTATANADIYITPSNTISLAMDTNCIIFEDVTGTENIEKKNALIVNVESSLPYELNASLDSNIVNGDKSIALDPNVLNIKLNSDSEYKSFTGIKQKINLANVTSDSNSDTYNIDLKVDTSKIEKADSYKASVKIEVEQK